DKGPSRKSSCSLRRPERKLLPCRSDQAQLREFATFRPRPSSSTLRIDKLHITQSVVWSLTPSDGGCAQNVQLKRRGVHFRFGEVGQWCRGSMDSRQNRFA